MDFEKIGEELIYHGRVFDLVKAIFRMSSGKEHRYDLVKHHGAVVIVPVDNQGRILFVRQYRVGAEQTLLELPAGLLEEDETPESSAAREIQEEVGMAAQSLVKLGEFYMVPGYSTEKLYAFLASGLYPSTLPTDEDEYLELVALPIQEVFERVRAGSMEDGKTLASLLLAQPFLEQQTGKNFK